MVDSSESDRDEQPDGGDAEELGLEQFESVADQPGISLDELSQAYAELIGKGEDPYEAPQEPPDVPSPVPPVEPVEEAPEDEACQLCPRSIVEAILFVGHPENEPFSSEKLASLMRGVPPREIDDLVAELNAEYAQREHPFHVAMHASGYRLELRPEFASLRDVFYGRIREARLSQAAIEVLAIVAYQQGSTRADVEKVRQHPSGALLSQLVRRRLLQVERPEEKPRRPKYYVTDRFLDLFGLESIDELPQSQEME